ncbi:unnamed protein product [Fraxinus pennsylvanica]|uniref:Uncharacterized protein n=1 Tax=Fraxinus pennsylvanica TaxID=56036 RepID=A0AAD2DXM9_9LAMI|nr:unnamed protein product [Fraxinus pennsylvanica]
MEDGHSRYTISSSPSTIDVTSFMFITRDDLHNSGALCCVTVWHFERRCCFVGVAATKTMCSASHYDLGKKSEFWMPKFFGWFLCCWQCLQLVLGLTMLVLVHVVVVLVVLEGWVVAANGNVPSSQNPNSNKLGTSLIVVYYKSVKEESGVGATKVGWGNVADCPAVEGECSEDDTTYEDYSSVQKPAFCVIGEPDFDSGPPWTRMS